MKWKSFGLMAGMTLVLFIVNITTWILEHLSNSL